MLLRYDSHGNCNAMADLSPIIHDGTRLTLEQSEKTSNRFEIIQPWLVAISAVDFLEEHWHKEGIQAGFAKLGPIIDIVPACLNEGDRSIF
jgi:hypothetical protein